MMTEYVTFRLANQIFALPLERVREIIRMPEVAHVPLAPTSLLGLANLRGLLLPVVCLNALLFQSSSTLTDSTRVVVAENKSGALVGFVVDRMDRVINVDDSKMESADIMQDTVQSEFLVGILKNVAGHAMVLIFDLDQLMAGEYSHLGRKTTSSGSGLDDHEHSLRQHNTMEEETQLVTFLLDRQEYAFPIHKVREIVRIPTNISQVPKAAPYLLGMINLREELLPLVSLRRIFGMSEDVMDE
ncbi:MAG: chemotaxis protein CheW, partial [Magnetococcales bacterium]|nr:chemotaxis protein CheW [Magnetococcales bacterium]